MDQDDFEGSLVLEKLAAINAVDAFYEAVDGDDFGEAKRLMVRAGIDSDTIQIVLAKMATGE